MQTSVTADLANLLEPKLVAELFEAYVEAKQNYYLGGLRLSEVEGGRFCEAAFRLLEFVTTGSYTSLGTQLDTEQLINRLRQIPAASQPDSVRLHIPRALRLVYDIRNKRDAAHLADGIDPNVQDATLVIHVLDWILAEFVRLYHKVSPDDATEIIDGLVTRLAPVVQDFNGFLKVLNPKLLASDYCLVLLYYRGKEGATFAELAAWVPPSMRNNLRRTLSGMTHGKAHVHNDGVRYYITRLGQHEVESRKLIMPFEMN